MRFSVPAFIALLSFGSNALAAECYNRAGGYPCATVNAVQNALASYCANFYNLPCKPFTAYTALGPAVWIAHVGPFKDEFECYYAGHEILQQCYGVKDGGSWTSNRKSINVNYCKW
ncbi:hypothetical protein EMPG_11924 [Blastomyces silverae]|uniref:Uncharacterized protein n=1 Tax=Blastomyces silverae TaxID=2060906 RepID=A0A0H1BVQ5_9EURO|nr:hypothetical protein EMPG_11924 [Blastomyces silverae]